MKRLLAYLFIVLSLGLTFSVSANANNSYVEGICIGNGDIYQEKYQLRLNTKKYPCKLSIVIRKSTNPKQYNNLKELIPKKYGPVWLKQIIKMAHGVKKMVM